MNNLFSEEPRRFAEYLNKAMLEDKYPGSHPAIGDVVWADKVVSYIEWLRSTRSAESGRYNNERPFLVD